MSSAEAPGRAFPLSLIVLDPSGNRSRVTLEPLPFRIGRQTDNHLVLRDNRISRAHAQIVEENGGHFLEDLGSRHGIYVNGVRVTRQELRPSDNIDFGFPDSYHLVFAVGEGEIYRLADQVSTTIKTDTAGHHLTRLRALMEVARALQTSLTTNEVLGALVDAALAITRAERGFLLLRKGDDLEVRVARDKAGRALAEDELRVPRSLIHKALTQRQELLSMEFNPAAAEPAPSQTMMEMELTSVVCVPLVKVQAEGGQDTAVLSAINETQGVLYMDSRGGSADLSGSNRELLQTLAIEASTILENARLLEGERERQRMEEEMKIARSIQESLLPRQMPSSGWFRAAGRSVPSNEVGGDYFDVREISPECWSVVAADVSGKGVSSALLASLLQGIFLNGAESPSQMGQMIERVNRFLLERTEGEKYATLFYCTVHRDGTLRWINAGHCPPLLVKPGEKIAALPSTGLPVGMLEEATYETRENKLAPGDKIVIYTDGFSEARSADGAFFGESRVRETVAAYSGSGAAELCQALNGAVLSFTSGTELRDDITLVILEYRP